MRSIGLLIGLAPLACGLPAAGGLGQALAPDTSSLRQAVPPVAGLASLSTSALHSSTGASNAPNTSLNEHFHADADEEALGFIAQLLRPLGDWEQQKVWQALQEDSWEGLCSILIFACATLASASGQGGGGMFVPLLMILSHLRVELAVPLSQSMIMCGSLVNLYTFICSKHPDFKNKPVIDYDAVVLFMPLQCLGVTLGVLVNYITPAWLLMSLLCITLAVAMWRSLLKGLKQREAEKGLGSDGSKDPEPHRLSISAVIAMVQTKQRQIIGTLLIWAVMLLSCFHGIQVCTSRFVAYMSVLTTLMLAFTVFIANHVVGPSGTVDGLEQDPVNWVSGRQFGLMKFPLVGFGAGFMGGLCGLGGGIIMGPVLLEVGMHSEAVQATTSVFVFLSSSIACIQFAIAGHVVWHYTLWYGFIGVVATLLGQHLCEVYIRRTRRYSLISLSIALVMCISLLCLAGTGIRRSMMHEKTPRTHRPDSYGGDHFSSRLCGEKIRVMRHRHKPYMPYIP